MAKSGISPAKAVLLAVNLASQSDISTLRNLISQHRKSLRIEIVLRILLSHLPESTDPSEYVELLQDLVEGNLAGTEELPLDTAFLNNITELEASKKVKHLRLLPLTSPNAPENSSEDPFVRFLIHRSIRIDHIAGLIDQVPSLLGPFLQHSSELRQWMISVVLPLLRLKEYYPHEAVRTTLSEFERMDDGAAVALLLSGTGQLEMSNDSRDISKDLVGRDLRNLVGPWLYGESRLQRRKFQEDLTGEGQTISSGDEEPGTRERCASWEEVFKWLTAQATSSWKIAVQAIEQWEGPGDVDLGGYEDGSEWLDEEDQQHLERRYAQATIACAYLVSEASLDALMGINRILLRLVTLLELDGIPTLEAAGRLLLPVENLGGLLQRKNIAFLRKGLLESSNILTKPNEASIKMLHALLISSYIFTKEGTAMSIRRAAELALLQQEFDQRVEFERLLLVHNGRGPKADDRYWIRTRKEFLWLRNWGSNDLKTQDDGSGCGVFGQVPNQEIEIALLKTFLSNNRVLLAQSIYQNSQDKPFSQDLLRETLISAAMEAFDNATNGNMTRGGVKRCNEILKAFPEALGELVVAQTEQLIKLTHEISEYRLVIKREPFKPVVLRVHSDPISILGIILEQNDRAYTRVKDFIKMAKQMVLAGLIKSDQANVEKRVISMCIDTALADDDYETAYSYVTTQLSNVAGPARAHTSSHSRKGSGHVEKPPAILDDWSWKAALQAGKYKRNQHSVRPTHTGNVTANVEIRHLQQRMDCLSLALRCAPSSALQEILNAYRRCEEELETQMRQEEEEENAWDEQGDDKTMPGGFATSTPRRHQETVSRHAEEVPMSLFDLSRTLLQGSSRAEPKKKARPLSQESIEGAVDSGAPRERKRDQIRNAAAGTLASGLGYLLGAPPPSND